MLKYKKINIKDKVIYFDLDDFRYVSGKIVQSDDYIEEYRICKQDRLKKLVLLMANKCNCFLRKDSNEILEIQGFDKELDQSIKYFMKNGYDDE